MSATKQCYIVVEYQGKSGPCTNHLHMYLHYAKPIQLETVKKNIKTIVDKYHNYEKDGSVFKSMLKTNSCYVYKDYLNKYDDTDIVHADGFNVDMFREDLPDEATQALLQAIVPSITLSAVWANHEEQWHEFAGNDLSVDSCHRYLANRFYIAKDLDPVLDPRKLQQLIAVIFRHDHGILVRNRGWDKWAEDLQQELEDNTYHNNSPSQHKEKPDNTQATSTAQYTHSTPAEILQQANGGREEEARATTLCMAWHAQQETSSCATIPIDTGRRGHSASTTNFAAGGVAIRVQYKQGQAAKER